MACTGLKMGSFHFFVHAKWSRTIFGNTCLTHFLTHFCPKTTQFQGILGFRMAKTGHHELKTRQKHLFWHSMWSRIIFRKSQFFAPGGLC